MGRRPRILAAALVGAGAAAVAAAQSAAEFDLRVVSQELPAEIETATGLEVAVTIANDGTRPWSPAEGFALSYHWLDPRGRVVVRDGRRTALPATIAGGEERAFVAVVEAPRLVGEHALQWDVVHEGVRWLSEVDPTPVQPSPVTLVAGHDFELVAGASVRMVVAASELAVPLALRNTGRRSWADDGSFAVSYHWLGRDGAVADWEGRRTPLPRSVAPGETIELTARVAVPARPGLYRLRWDMVEEGVCWFSDRSPGLPPARLVLAAPDVLSAPAWWAVFCLVAAAAAVSATARGGARLAAVFAAADVLWLAGGLVVKQGAVLAAAGARATGGGLLMTLGGGAAAALVVLVLPGRWRPAVCWLAAAAATVLLWADVVYIRFFQDLPGAAALSAAGQVGRVEASIRSLLRVSDLWIALDLLPGLVLVTAARRLRRETGAGAQRLIAAALVSTVAGAAVAALQLADRQPQILQQVFRRLEVARQLGVLNLHAVDLGAAALRSWTARELAPERVAEVAAWFREVAPQRAGVGPWFGSAAGCDLVMVQVESLQGFVIGLEIGGREVTPFLNRWRREALWFSNLSDQTAHGRSSDSELATQVSLLPGPGGAAAFRFAGNDFTGLAEVLGERGYRTLSAVPYDGGFWNRRVTHPAYGFERSLFVDDFAAGEEVGWGLSDRDFLGQAAARLAELPSPSAVYLLTLSLHHPFAGFPPHLRELDVGGWEGTPFGNFLHTMHFFDASLASFVAALDEGGRAERTVVAVWGDHDAGFEWRPEIAAAMGARRDAAGWYLSQEVPLFIRVPQADGLLGERTAAAGHVDVAPTLLALLGVDPAPYPFVGRNLLGEPGAGPVLGEYGCWRTDELLFLQGDGSLAGGRCLELATMAAAPAARCAAGFGTARRAEEVSALVLEHDLQQRIRDALASAETVRP
ncbi:MAG: sulfatase-like hydrolase/transferase [Thermoanaerobaculales bacterium]|nr:sulfatase-like hydrolase/transferase [Thermoanaerobaculales bacterium]